MKTFLKRFLPCKNKWPLFLLRSRLMADYKKRHGYKMNLKNPKTFTEKLQWYKLYFKGDGHLERIVDKYLFKDYIKEHLGEGYTIPLLGAWTDINQLEKDWSSLPEEFCLKSTLQSDGNCIKFIHNKSSIPFDTIKKELKEWLNPKKTLINSFCKAYYNATPRILAEEYMQNVKDQLFDYKFFCFDGEPYCIYTAVEHFSEKGSTITFYDLNWEKMDVQYGNHEVGDLPKPIHYEEMLTISKKLSKGFPFLRVDFFDTKEKLLLAELTLYPGGGNTPYKPNSFNETLGNLFKLPSSK